MVPTVDGMDTTHPPLTPIITTTITDTLRERVAAFEIYAELAEQADGVAEALEIHGKPEAAEAVRELAAFDRQCAATALDGSRARPLVARAPVMGWTHAEAVEVGRGVVEAVGAAAFEWPAETAVRLAEGGGL